MLTEIVQRAQAAGAALAEHAQQFARLRDLAARAPDLLTALHGRVQALSGRLPAARSTLAQLAERYPATALAGSAANPDRAQERLEFAGSAVSDGREALSSGPRGRAALAVRAAEEA